MADMLTIGIILTAIDRASSVIGDMAQRSTQEFTRVQDRIDQVSKRLGQMGIASLGSGMIMAGALQRPVAAFMALEDAATELQSALMKAGGGIAPEFERINQLALDLGNRLPGTTADFQLMMTTLIRQGISAQAVLGGLGEAAAYLGVQLKMPPAAAAEFVAQLQDATRTVEGDMLGLADTIQRAFNVGVAPQSMLDAFAALGPAMDTIRMQGLAGANALAPLVAMLDQAGMSGSTAGIALEKIFRFGFNAKNMADANAALKEFGVSLNFLNEQGEFAGLDNFFKQLDKLKNIPTAERIAALTEAFGQDAQTLQALTTIIDRGAAGYANMTAKMREQADLNARVGAQLGTLRNLWEAFTGTVTNALAAVGALWGPELKSLTGWLNDLAGAFQKLAAGPSAFDQKFAAMKGLVAQGAQWSGLIKTLTGVAAAIAAALVSFGVLGLALSGIGKGLAVIMGGFTMVGKALALLAGPAKFIFSLGQAIFWLARGVLAVAIPAIVAFGKALFALTMAHPVLAIIAALAAAAILLWQNWDKVKALFLKFWEPIKAQWATFTTFVAQWINQVRQTIVGGIQAAVAAVQALAGQMYQAGVNLITQLWNGIQAKAAAMIDYVKGIAGQVASFFVGKSPPPAGPLRFIHRNRLIETLAESLQPGPVVAAAAQVAGALSRAWTPPPRIGLSVIPGRVAASPAGGGAITLNYQPIIHVGGGDGLTTMRTLLQQHAGDLVRLLEEAQAQRARRRYA